MTTTLAAGIGLSFSERMAGTFTVTGTGPAPLEFVLTITFDDLGAMFRSPRHEGRITGTVTAPTLSPKPLSVSAGVFNLFIQDPTAVATRQLRYDFVMQAEDGRRIHFTGVKTVRDDPGLDVWADTTTLAITLHDGSDATGPELGTGVLRLSPVDLARELTTFAVTGTDDERVKLEALGQFGRFFAGQLYRAYGGVLLTSGVFDPDAPPRRRRPLDVGVPEVHFADAGDGAILKLTRYRGGAKGPVLLVHGLGVSSLIFAIDTIQPNLLEYLFGHGYDVWLLDNRSSIDLPYAHRPYTADDIARRDYPAAVAKVLALTGAPSLQAVVHCFGATTFFMAMLAGLQGVRSAAVSQIATHLRVPALTKAKAIFRVPQVLDALGIREMTAEARTNEDLLQKVGDLLLRLYPVHDGPRDTSAVSRRISFIYGQLYQVDQLNQATYDNLHEMFGVACIASLEHLTAMIRAGHIVAADGSDVYLGEAQHYPNLHRLALPITILHGELNQCWYPESTAITIDLLRQHNDPRLYERIIIPGYGHIDCIFGKDAARDVYPHILRHLEPAATV